MKLVRSDPGSRCFAVERNEASKLAGEHILILSASESIALKLLLSDQEPRLSWADLTDSLL